MNKVIEKSQLEVSNGNVQKRINKNRSFFFRYLELCRARNLTPLPDVKAKNNKPNCFELYGDKISVTDWLLIVEALFNDQILQSLALKTRKCGGAVLDQFDTERKAKLFKQKPAIYTKFIFSGLIEAICNCLNFNKNLRVLHLEGLPLSDIYVDTIAKAIATNEQLRDVSFARSNIQDDGCETICNTVKYLENIERVNLSECGLTTRGAECIADMIKMQKISRYTEGWQKSLRYRDVDPNSIPGLREIILSRNPSIEDNGVKVICEVLKEDVWIKVIEMEGCGITDLGANCIIDCLTVNNFITEFNVNNNNGISKFLLRTIFEQLGKEDEEQKAIEEHQQYVNGVTSANLGMRKVTMGQLRDRLKFLEDQLEFERVLRKKAEQLNERLNQQIIAYESQIEEAVNSKLPEGFVVVRGDALQSIIKERNEMLELNGMVPKDGEEHKLMNTHRSESLSTGSTEVQQSTRTIPLVNIYEAAQDEMSDEDLSQRKTARVRKIKSEMVQIEMEQHSPQKHKPEARSDNEFISDAEFQMGSMNYGSYAGQNSANNGLDTQRNVSKTYRTERKVKKMNSPPVINSFIEEDDLMYGDVDVAKKFIKDTEELYNFADAIKLNTNSKGFAYEVDDLQLESSRTELSGGNSGGSGTMRHSTTMAQSMKLFITPKTAKPNNYNPQKFQAEIGQGDGGELNKNIETKKMQKKSPRSLFFGVCED